MQENATNQELAPLFLDFKSRLILSGALLREPLENLGKMRLLKSILSNIDIEEDDAKKVDLCRRPDGSVSWNPEKLQQLEHYFTLDHYFSREEAEVLKQAVNRNLPFWTLAEAEMVEWVSNMFSAK